MSTRPHAPVRGHWPRPGEWPVWLVPLLLAFVQVIGTFGAQYGPPEGARKGPPWSHGGPWPDGPAAIGSTPLDPVGIALVVGGPVLLLFRRRYPVFTFAAVGAVTALYFLRAYTYGPAPLALGVAAFACVMAGHRAAAWAGSAGGLAAFFTLTAFIGVPLRDRGRPGRTFPVEEPALGTMTVFVGWALAVLIGGELLRMRAQRAAETARTRAEEERRQASEERLRMARELHDVLAHNISMINVQAGVALHLIDDDPGQARTALAAIKDASKEALTEMRSVIGALRAQGETAPRAPTAGLAELDELLARAGSAGLTVESEVVGDRGDLHAGTDLAAYRIVQEALTNVTRHAGPGPVTARVRVAYRDREVEVRVEDDGRGVSLLDDRPAGSGIRGMRERAAALGGTFDAGSRPGGGFAVRATLPRGEPEESADPAAGRDEP